MNHDLDSVVDNTIKQWSDLIEEGKEAEAQEVLESTLEDSVLGTLAPVQSFLDVWKEADTSLEDLPTDEVSRSYYVRQNLQKATKLGTTLSLACCELLYMTMKSQYWREWEAEFDDGMGKVKRCYESFQEFAINEMGLERRKAYTLAEFYGTYVVDAKVPKEVVAALPYSKAMIAKEVVTDRNWRTVVDKVQNLSTEALRRWVVRERSEKDESVKLRRLNIMLSDSQWENVQTAIELACKDIASEDRGAAIDFICMDFLSGQLDTPGGKDAVRRLNRHVEALERNFKVRFGPPQEIDHDMYQDLFDVKIDDIDKQLVDDSFEGGVAPEWDEAEEEAAENIFDAPLDN